MIRSCVSYCWARGTWKSLRESRSLLPDTCSCCHWWLCAVLWSRGGLLFEGPAIHFEFLAVPLSKIVDVTYGSQWLRYLHYWCGTFLPRKLSTSASWGPCSNRGTLWRRLPRQSASSALTVRGLWSQRQVKRSVRRQQSFFYCSMDESRTYCHFNIFMIGTGTSDRSQVTVARLIIGPNWPLNNSDR